MEPNQEEAGGGIGSNTEISANQERRRADGDDGGRRKAFSRRTLRRKMAGKTKINIKKLSSVKKSQQVVFFVFNQESGKKKASESPQEFLHRDQRLLYRLSGGLPPSTTPPSSTALFQAWGGVGGEGWGGWHLHTSDSKLSAGSDSDADAIFPLVVLDGGADGSSRPPTRLRRAW